MLSVVQRISSVSGGSIASGYLAYVWEQLGAPDAVGSYPLFKDKYVEPILAFSRQKIDIGDILTGLLPWTSAAKQVESSYDELLFHGSKLKALPDKPESFLRHQYADWRQFPVLKVLCRRLLVGRIANPDLAISTAVTASSAFRPSSRPLSSRCRLSLPIGRDSGGAGSIIDPAPFRAKVLLDRRWRLRQSCAQPIIKRYMTLLVSDGGAPFARSADVATDPIRQLQHVFDVTDNQVRSLRRRDLIDQFEASKTANLQENQIDPYAVRNILGH